LLPLFRNTRGLLQYVVHITMIAQFVAICYSYCNTMKARQKDVILRPIHVLLQYETIFLQQYIWLAPHARIVAIYVRISQRRFTLLQYLASIATKWLVLATWHNCRNITTISQRWYDLWQYMTSTATKGELTATKENYGNMLILLPWSRILW